MNLKFIAFVIVIIIASFNGQLKLKAKSKIIKSIFYTLGSFAQGGGGGGGGSGGNAKG